jgi:hypothetical protein
LGKNALPNPLIQALLPDAARPATIAAHFIRWP